MFAVAIVSVVLTTVRRRTTLYPGLWRGGRGPVEESLEKLESYDLGEGWYRDGETRQMDHYIGFAMHFYGLLYAALNGAADPERAARRVLVTGYPPPAWCTSMGAREPQAMERSDDRIPR